MIVVTVVLAAAVTACAVLDARTGRVPNAVTLPAMAVVGAASVSQPIIAGAAAVCAAPYLVAFARRACGGGDVKLAAVCGGLLAEPAAAALVVVGAAVLTAAVLVVRRRRRMRHGPVLVSVTLAWLVTGVAGASETIGLCCVG